MARSRFVPRAADAGQATDGSGRRPFPRRDAAVGRRHARRTNETVIGFAKDLAPHPDRVWDLSCECGAEGCYEKVCLTIAEYHRHCGKGTYVVAPGHAGRARVVARTDTFAVIVP